MISEELVTVEEILFGRSPGLVANDNKRMFACECVESMLCVYRLWSSKLPKDTLLTQVDSSKNKRFGETGVIINTHLPYVVVLCGRFLLVT